jgi:hypothetical protein
VIVLPPSPVDVYVTEQLAVLPLPESVQLVLLKVPAPVLLKLTLPVGVVCVPMSMSLTVAAQVVDWPVAITPGVRRQALSSGRDRWLGRRHTRVNRPRTERLETGQGDDSHQDQPSGSPSENSSIVQDGLRRGEGGAAYGQSNARR